jgi:hypothetical protein
MAKIEGFSMQYEETHYTDASGKAISFGLIVDRLFRRPYSPWKGAPYLVITINRPDVCFEYEEEP